MGVMTCFARPCLVAAALVTSVQAQVIAPKANWAGALPSSTVIGARADTIVTKMLASFGAVDRAKIQREFDAFAKSPRGSATERVRSATYLAAGYDNLALLFAADAVRRDPKDGLSAGNLGALIYSKDGPGAAVELLRYANDLAPKTLSIVTTLGCVAMALGEIDRAKPYFEAALRIDMNAGEALLGMGAYWMHKRDPKAAFEYFVRAGGVTYERKAALLPPPVDSDGDPVPPPKPVEAPPSGASASGAESEGGSAHPTGVDVTFPPSPDWSGPDAFVAAGTSRTKFGEWFTAERDRKMQRLSDVLGQYASKPFPSGDPIPGVTPVEPLSTDYPRALNDQWLTANIKKAIKDFDARVAPGLARLGSAPQFVPPPSSGSSSLPAAQAALRAAIRKNCTDAHALLTGTWMVIKPAQAKLFDDVNELLKKYYKAQAGWIRKIDDPDLYAAAVAGRDAIVLSTYSALLLQEDVLRIALALSIVSGGTESSTQCPGEAGSKAPDAPADPPLPELGAPPRVPCPFAKSPIDLSGKIESLDISAEFKLDCEGVKYGAGAGPFSAARTRIFKTKTIVDYKVEVEKSVSDKGGTLSVKATGAVQIVRTDAGRETMTTNVELEGKAAIWGVAEASITGGLSSIASDVQTKKPPPPSPTTETP